MNKAIGVLGIVVVIAGLLLIVGQVLFPGYFNPSTRTVSFMDLFSASTTYVGLIVMLIGTLLIWLSQKAPGKSEESNAGPRS